MKLSEPSIESGGRQHIFTTVPITLEQIVEETRQWPAERLGELVDRLSAELHPVDAEYDAAWKQEARRRLAGIEDGSAEAVDGELVAARVRKIVGR